MQFRKTIGTVLKDALAMNNKPFPWQKAIGAGLAMSIPVIIGILLNNLAYGLLAGLGGFAYLYSFPIPYAQLAKKLTFVVIGTTCCAILGTLAAPYPLAISLIIGLIAAISVFIFGALKMIGPSAIFFVLIFAIISDMPVAPELVFVRAGLIFLGGCLAWIIAMSGFLINPHGPETNIVKRVYTQLSIFMSSVGTADFHHEKSKMMSVLKEAEETLAAGYISWYPSSFYKRLAYLALNANAIFLLINEHYASDEQLPIPESLITPIKEVGRLLNRKNVEHLCQKLNTVEDHPNDQALQKKTIKIQSLLTKPISEFPTIDWLTRISIKEILTRNIDRNSLVFITAVRMGLITTIASIIAFQFDFLVRSYWIPISCVAIMSGASLVATYHRAIQRSVGTLIGVIIASIILALQPSGYTIALLIFCFTATVELCIVRNYGLAVIFITPNALLIAESITGGTTPFFYFASARIVDILIGSAIGIIGVMSTGKRTASLRIPRIMMRTLRNQSQLLLILFSPKTETTGRKKEIRILKMKTSLANLQALYDAAISEIPKNQELLEYYWPIIYSIERLAFFLEQASLDQDQPTLSDAELAQMLYLFETMANAAGHLETTSIKPVPTLKGYGLLQQEIMSLQKTFQIKQ